jgi:hypothetical protein
MRLERRLRNLVFNMALTSMLAIASVAQANCILLFPMSKA